MSATAVPIKPVSRGAIAKLWIGLAILVIAAAVAAWAGTRGTAGTTTSSGLRYQVLKQGTGPNASAQDVALIEYEGRLADGTVFDSTAGKRAVPLPVMGSIPGFSEGLRLMNKGAKYRLWIPSRLAYGPEANGPIPANSDLEFDVTLVDFRSLTELQAAGGGMPPGM